MNEEQFEVNKNKKDKSAMLTGVKNLLWSLSIIISLAAVVVGLVFATFHRNNGDKISSELSEPITAVSEDGSSHSSVVLGEGSGNARGILNELTETPDAGEVYISRITFLIDSTFINLRQLQLVDPNQVWATSSGSMPMGSVHEAIIKFPNDGSEITAASAAMVAQPEMLVIGIGMDGLSKVDERTFLINYETLIKDIQASSPDTKIICCGLASVIPGYTGSDKLDVGMVSNGNDWVQLACRDTGVYYLNIGEDLCESVQLLTRFAASNGKTLNRTGVETFLTYVKQHAIQ